MRTVARLRDDRQRVVYPLFWLLSFPKEFFSPHRSDVTVATERDPPHLREEMYQPRGRA